MPVAANEEVCLQKKETISEKKMYKNDTGVHTMVGYSGSFKFVGIKDVMY
jgi:hypothetical protein